NNANFASGAATVSLTLAEQNVAEGPVHFSINPPGPLTLAPGASQTVTVTFTVGSNASEAGPRSGSINIELLNSDPVCSDLNIGTIGLTGTGTLAQVDIAPSVAYGHIDCGTTAPPKSLAIGNPGNQDFTITNITLAPMVQNGTLFFAFPAGDIGTVVASGTQFNLPITPSAIPQTVDAVNNGSQGTATVDDGYSAIL